MTYFSEIVKYFNSKVNVSEKIDEQLVDLRNAFAHGTIAEINGSVAKLLHLKRMKGTTNVKVEICIELTEEWLQNKAQEILTERRKVISMIKRIQKN